MKILIEEYIEEIGFIPTTEMVGSKKEILRVKNFFVKTFHEERSREEILSLPRAINNHKDSVYLVGAESGDFLSITVLEDNSILNKIDRAWMSILDFYDYIRVKLERFGD